MEKLNLKMAVSKTANTVEEAQDIAKNLIGKFPIIIRPAFTLGGTGGGIAYNQEELIEIVTSGIDASMTNQVRPVPQLWSSMPHLLLEAGSPCLSDLQLAPARAWAVLGTAGADLHQ